MVFGRQDILTFDLSIFNFSIFIQSVFRDPPIFGTRLYEILVKKKDMSSSKKDQKTGHGGKAGNTAAEHQLLLCLFGDNL